MVAHPPCVCGGGKALPKKLGREDLEELTVKTKLKPAEVRALYARFRRLAPSGYLLPEQFKQTMGVLGLTDDPFLPDRMFRVFDCDQDGKLSFFEFASSLAVMIRGTEDEKLKLSFEMTAGQRGASGISLEDFQRLVSSCNTMMLALMDSSRRYTSQEDATRVFRDLASGGSSGEEEEAVITLEAYKNAVRNSEDFLFCLGLEPNPRRRGRSTAAPASPQPRTDGSVVISAAQLEDLRARVATLRMVTQRPRRQGAGWCSSGGCTPPPQAASSSGEDSEERWWSPICCCHPERRPAPPSRARRGRMAQNPFDEVCEELDGIVGWLANCSGAGQAAPATGSASSPLQPWASCGRLTAVAGTGELTVGPLRDAPSRDCSRDLPADFTARPSVHAPNAGADGRGAQFRGAQSYGRSRSAGLVSNTSGSRSRRRHRLLGPKKGLAVHFGHENWNMVLSMMVGIRMSLGRTKGEIARELQPVDFIMKEKFTIIPRIANIFDSAVSKRVTLTRFMDYAPLVFQRIRSSFGIVHDEYLRSVGPDQLLGNMVLGNLSSLSELSSEGKSGAFFYYTADGKYMMKTVSPKEHRLLKRMLTRYYDHIMRNPGTLIVRFLGLHSLRVHKQRKAGSCLRPVPLRQTRKLHFVVMGNMFNTPFEIHRRYDLKGSWVGRMTPSDRFDPSVALKDVDFKQANETIRVGEEQKERLIRQIESDSAFLRDNNIIDYSLLLGIHDMGTGTVPAFLNAGGDDTTSETGSEKAAAAAERSMAALTLGGTAALTDRPPTADTTASCSGLLFPGSPSSAAAAAGLAAQSSALAEGHEVPLHQCDMGGMLSADRKSLYFFGIIDILTPYDTAKKAEHHFKAMRYDGHGVSCCPPGMYSQRFNEFLRRAFV